MSCGTSSVELDLPRVHATYHSFHQPWELESSKQLYCQTDIVPIKVYIYFINYILCYHHVLLLLSISELCLFIKSLRPTPDSNWTLEFQESVKNYNFPLDFFSKLMIWIKISLLICYTILAQRTTSWKIIGKFTWK